MKGGLLLPGEPVLALKRSRPGSIINEQEVKHRVRLLYQLKQQTRHRRRQVKHRIPTRLQSHQCRETHSLYFAAILIIAINNLNLWFIKWNYFFYILSKLTKKLNKIYSNFLTWPNHIVSKIKKNFDFLMSRNPKSNGPS